MKVKVAQLCPTLRPLGIYSPWNSLGQNTGVGSLSVFHGLFPTQGSNPGLPHCMQILYQLSHKETQEHWSGWPIPSPVDLPDSGIEPGSSALQVDSLPTELSGKPIYSLLRSITLTVNIWTKHIYYLIQQIYFFKYRSITLWVNKKFNINILPYLIQILNI